MKPADTATVIAACVSAVSAFFAFLSARASRDGVAVSQASVEALQADLEHARGTTRHELTRAFESDFAKQYDSIWEVLGPWEDPVQVDATERRVVHDMLATLASVYVALTQGLLEREQADYLGELFGDWLGTPKALHIWRKVFGTSDQEASWPPGFIPWINGLLGDTDASAASAAG